MAMASAVDEIVEMGPFLATVRSTLQMNPGFFPGVAQYLRQQAAMANAQAAQIQRQMHQSNMQHMQQMGQMQQQAWQTQQETSDLISQGYWDRSAAMDEAALDWSQTIRDVETWHDPTGPDVELPIGFESAVTDGQGNYVVSEQPEIDPNDLPYNRDWTQLERPD